MIIYSECVNRGKDLRFLTPWPVVSPVFKMENNADGTLSFFQTQKEELFQM